MSSITRCCGLCLPLLSASLLRLSSAPLKQGAHPHNSDDFDDFSAKTRNNYNVLKTSCYTVQPSPASAAASNFIVLEKVKPFTPCSWIYQTSPFIPTIPCDFHFVKSVLFVPFPFRTIPCDNHIKDSHALSTLVSQTPRVLIHNEPTKSWHHHQQFQLFGQQ